MDPSASTAAGLPRDRYWLHLLLFFLTTVTTCAGGAQLADAFQHNRALSMDDLIPLAPVLDNPSAVWSGIWFSLTLMLILTAHELGHYLAARYYGIQASLPYFLPSPLLIGTVGAFIRIRSPIMTRRELFDIGIAGPIAGFVFAIPAFAIGIAWSKVVPGISSTAELTFGVPLLQRALEAVIFPGIASQDILLHPVARAAWVGTFTTALNLLPIGQLDGGHILYAIAGQRHRLLSRIFLAALVPLGIFVSRSWLLWALLLLLFGMRHPRIYDAAPLSEGRVKLGVLALGIFLLSFMLAPIQ